MTTDDIQHSETPSRAKRARYYLTVCGLLPIVATVLLIANWKYAYSPIGQSTTKLAE